MAGQYRDKSWPKLSREKKAAGGVFKTVKHIFLLIFKSSIAYRSRKTLFDKMKSCTSVFLEGDSATANHVVPWISPSLLSIRGYTIVRARALVSL